MNIASVLGLRQSQGVTPYAISKAGVVQLTKCLALELAACGVRVNALAPGYVVTDINRSLSLSLSVSSVPNARIVSIVYQERNKDKTGADHHHPDAPLESRHSAASCYGHMFTFICIVICQTHPLLPSPLSHFPFYFPFSRLCSRCVAT